MKLFSVIVLLALAGCASAPKLPNSQTANERFSTLGYHDKWVATDFYRLGEGDEIKRLYWGQRASQEHASGYSEASPVERLQRKYVVLPVPEHVDPDGTVKEASNQVVEVVQLWAVTRSHGHKLFLVN
jgi:hypothetical protein